MRIKQVKQGSHVNGLHLPSREKGWLLAFVFFGFMETMKPQEFFPSCSEHVSFAILLFGLFSVLAGPLLIHPFMGGGDY